VHFFVLLNRDASKNIASRELEFEIVFEKMQSNWEEFFFIYFPYIQNFLCTENSWLPWYSPARSSGSLRHREAIRSSLRWTYIAVKNPMNYLRSCSA